MKSKILLLLFFLLSIYIPFSSSGQTDSTRALIIDKNTVYKRGVYKTFEEFKYNSPSLLLHYPVKQFRNKKGKVPNDPREFIYTINMPEDSAYKLRRVFGVCDGKDIFLAHNQGLFSSTKLAKMEFVGRYCIFNAYKLLTTFNAGFDNTANVSSRHRNELSVLNMINGSITVLNRYATEDLIKSDKRLFDRYQTERFNINREEIFKEYIKEYSLNHRSDLDPKAKPKRIENLETLIYKEESDKDYMYYFKRVRTYQIDPRIISISKERGKYGNKQNKYIGLVCKHKFTKADDYNFKIGTWRYFYKSGQLKEVINYDLYGKKHGLYIKYDENGEVVEKLNYVHGKKQT